MATAVLRELGGVAWFHGESKGGRWRGRELVGGSGNGAGARGVIIAGSGLALPGGSEQRRCAAFIASMQRSRSGAGRPSSAGSVRQSSTKPSLTAGFAIEITPYTKRFSEFFQNKSCSPKYHLQMLFNDLMLIRNIN